MNILIRHSYRAAFLKDITACSSIEVSDQWQHVDHLIETVTGESCDVIVDHFRRVAPVTGYDRCAAGQGFRDAESGKAGRALSAGPSCRPSRRVCASYVSYLTCGATLIVPSPHSILEKLVIFLVGLAVIVVCSFPLKHRGQAA